MSAVRIVIVDDHPIVRHGLIGVFADEPDIDVVGEADSGPRGLAVIADNEPDVVLMDVRMPGGDGVPAIRELAKSRMHGRPRVLVLTTYDTDRAIRSALDAGADGYLLKDASRTDLVRAVRDLAVGRPVLAPAVLATLVGREAETELTTREIDVLRLVSHGFTNKAIATRLRISESTVKTHLLHTYSKLEAADRAQAVRIGWERGLL